MYTLKIYWTRYVTDAKGVGGVADETTLFIPADEVRVHGPIVDAEKEMSTWDEGQYHDYSCVIENETTQPVGDGEFEIRSVTRQPGRLIEVVRRNRSSWYLATHAWILAANGDTIERVAA